MLALLMQDIKISNTFNAMYVDTVDTFCTQYTHMSMQSIQSNYNVDSNTKSLNYMKIWLKGLIYFELEQTLNYSDFELANS